LKQLEEEIQIHEKINQKKALEEYKKMIEKINHDKAEKRRAEIEEEKKLKEKELEIMDQRDNERKNVIIITSY
jgi:hypothetical protein